MEVEARWAVEQLDDEEREAEEHDQGEPLGPGGGGGEQAERDGGVDQGQRCPEQRLGPGGRFASLVVSHGDQQQASRRGQCQPGRYAQGRRREPQPPLD